MKIRLQKSKWKSSLFITGKKSIWMLSNKFVKLLMSL